jgi:hypothetical protein
VQQVQLDLQEPQVRQVLLEHQVPQDLLEQ